MKLASEPEAKAPAQAGSRSNKGTGEVQGAANGAQGLGTIRDDTGVEDLMLDLA